MSGDAGERGARQAVPEGRQDAGKDQLAVVATWIQIAGVTFSVVSGLVFGGTVREKRLLPPAGAREGLHATGRRAATGQRAVLGGECYVLRPSSSVFTNDQDKVDLDTGCPGWGDMHPRVGPSRCGEVADLIVDQEGVHTADGGPHLLMLDGATRGGYSVCRAALSADPNRSVSQLDVGGLRAGDQLCVGTDLGDTGLVRVEAVATSGSGGLAGLTISYLVWRQR